MTTWIAGLNLAVNVAVSVALYKPYGIAGIVVGTGVSSAVMTFAQIRYLRRELHGRLGGRRTAIVALQITIASVLLGVASYLTWRGLDGLLGRSVPAQVLSVGIGLTVGLAVYAAAVAFQRIPEGAQIGRMLAGRLRR